MFSKIQFFFILISTLFFLSVQAWAVPFPPDPRVTGNVTSGWSYTDATGVGETSSADFDVESISGTFDGIQTFNMDFTVVGTAPATPVFGSGANLFVQIDYLDLDQARSAEAEANVMEFIDGLWNDLSTGITNSNPFTFSGNTVSVTMTLPITVAEAQAIEADGFFFRFTFGEAFGSEDVVDPYSGTLPTGLDQAWLYVVPEPGSFLLLGSGLGLLIPFVRRKSNR